MAWLLRVNGWVRGVLRILVVLSVVGLASTMTVQVVLRYLLEVSLMGVEEMSTLFGLWLYFAGMALVSAENQHIRGGLIAAMISARLHGALERVFLVLSAAICLYFLVLSLEYTGFILEVDRRSTFLRWPSALWVASLNLGLLLSAVSLAIHALKPARRSTP